MPAADKTRLTIVAAVLCAVACSGCLLEWDRVWPADGHRDAARDGVPLDQPGKDKETGPRPDGPAAPGSWAVALGAQDHAAADDVVLDKAGNIYITGNFRTAIIGKGTSLSAKKGFDLFVAKLSGQGKLLWAISGGGDGHDSGTAIRIAPMGGILVAGYFNKSLFLGGKEYKGPNQEGFVARVLADGTVKWVETYNGSGTSTIARMAVDLPGDVIWITGKFNGTLKLGSSTFNGLGWDTYVARLSAKNGAVEKALQVKGAQTEYPAALALDSSGNAFVAGNFIDSNKGTYILTIGGTPLSNRGNNDLFVTKINANADKFLWATSAGSTGSDESRDVVLDTGGNLYITGYHGGAMTLGSTTLTHSGNGNLYVARISPGGTFQWGVSSTGTLGAEGSAIALNKDQLLVCGFVMGPDVLGGKALTQHQGGRDVVLARLTTDTGEVLGITSGGGSQWDHGLGLAVGSKGNVFVTGLYQGSAVFGTTSFKSKGKQDVFVWKLAAP